MINLHRVGTLSTGISALILTISIFGPLFFGGVFTEATDGLVTIMVYPTIIILLVTIIYLFILIESSKKNLTKSNARDIWAIIILVLNTILLLIYWSLSYCDIDGFGLVLIAFTTYIVAPIFILQFILYVLFSISIHREIRSKGH